MVTSAAAPVADATSACQAPVRVAVGIGGRALRLNWADGFETTLSATALRLACRCAGCTHVRRGGGRIQLDTNVSLSQVAAFGVAGLQLVFSDGHRRGVYPWRYLRQLATHPPEVA